MIAIAFVAIGVLTIGEMLTHPVLEGYVAGRVPEASLGRAMGALTACFAIVFPLAPLIGTWVYEVYGHQVLWASSGAVSLLAVCGFVAADLRGRRV